MIAAALDAVHASMAKWWATELQKRVADRCLQLHDDYGYVTEYSVAKAFTDGRVQTTTAVRPKS